ncbi:MAG: NAD(+)/NADH kinase [Nitrospiraceae bacterium]|nr:NAD(+)/NADH kinase [Nitrospiraceae bacterium]
MNFKTIGIVLKENKPEAGEIIRGVTQWLEKRGLEILFDEESAARLGRPGLSRAELAARVDMVVAFGGDGTMLAMARLVAGRSVPILGVNLGGLGFITEVSVPETYSALEKALGGDCPCELRMMLVAEIRRHGELIAEYTVLNDVVLNKGATSKIIDIETRVDKTPMTTFKADGLIASTPTGSTAYNLSSGGPVLYPTVKGIILTPICSHTLAMRPIVVPEGAEIEIRPVTERADVFLSLDGQVGFALREKDTVTVRKSPHETRLLIPFGRDYFKILREKLRWGSR